MSLQDPIIRDIMPRLWHSSRAAMSSPHSREKMRCEMQFALPTLPTVLTDLLALDEMLRGRKSDEIEQVVSVPIRGSAIDALQ